MELAELLKVWDSGDGRPYKGQLIDWAAYEADPENIGCMCAQGQVLSLYANWTPDDLRSADQSEADLETAKQLNISRAHAILLRNINDSADGAPSIVLTEPGRVLGDKWSELLDFWWMLHRYEASNWLDVVAAWDAAWVAARDAARDAAGDAAGVAAWVAAGDAAREIQGFELLGERGRDVFFLPMFGIKTLADIPQRPTDYGMGLVPA